MKYCSQCGVATTENAAFCSGCGIGITRSRDEAIAQQVARETVNEHQANMIASDIAGYEKTSAIIWLIMGIIQCLSIVLMIAGIWNIFAAFTRFFMIKKIRYRRPDVPEAYRGVVGLILIGFVNLFLGGWLGVIMVGFDFWIRHRVLQNAAIFNVPEPVQTGSLIR